MTGIVNYGAGNIFSLFNSIKRLDEKVIVISTPEMLSKVHRIVLPGVGAFNEGMLHLTENFLAEAIIEEVKKGKPMLGICLGLQMLFEKSEEGKLKGLAILKGHVRKFPDRKNFPVPHMGWNSVRILHRCQFIKDVPDESFFYFAHSYYSAPVEKNIIYGTTIYGFEFASIVQKENLVGVQFHPEKSGDSGLRLLKNFIKMS
ncbi:MAG: imidazole glycerol phosphate synthase subunit HisH [Candidatus Omnitrophica bacterium]|nr:imidazole glycerol phosphate synthase subunit HisH [Candidatus Omnitrophota bacterium]